MANDSVLTTKETGSSPGKVIADIESAFRNITLNADHPPNKDTNINWLGSSYSGSDIKVIAHLYDVKPVEDKAAIHNDAADLLGGLRSYLSALNTNSLNPTSPEFYDRVWNQIFANTDSAGAQREVRPLFQRSTEIFFRASEYLIELGQAITDQQSLANELLTKQSSQQTLESQSSDTLVLASLQTLSVQSHREKFPVRGLGTDYVKAYTRGPRTIAGSMIFTAFNEHVLKHLIRRAAPLAKRYGEIFDAHTSTLLPDQLPPLDLTIVFANEYGSVSRMGIYGVEFVNDSITFSIEDLLSEQVMNYVARDVDIMTSVGKMKLSAFEQGMFTQDVPDQPLRASDLQFTDHAAYNNYLTRLGLRNRIRGR